jgi:hypothetical protein
MVFSVESVRTGRCMVGFEIVAMNRQIAAIVPSM